MMSKPAAGVVRVASLLFGGAGSFPRMEFREPAPGEKFDPLSWEAGGVLSGGTVGGATERAGGGTTHPGIEEREEEEVGRLRTMGVCSASPMQMSALRCSCETQLWLRTLHDFF